MTVYPTTAPTPRPARRGVRSLIAPGIATLVVLAILVALGTWQLQRLAWKEALIARVEERVDAAPVPLPPEAEWAALEVDDYDYRPVTFTGTFLNDLEAQGRKYGIDARSVVPDRWLEEGDTVDVAGHRFDVYHCPGHSPGSVVLFNAAQRFALVGDVLFRGSVGRSDFPYGDHEALISAIKTKLLPLGDDIAFICGHGPTSSFGAERVGNPFLV